MCPGLVLLPATHQTLSVAQKPMTASDGSDDVVDDTLDGQQQQCVEYVYICAEHTRCHKLGWLPLDCRLGARKRALYVEYASRNSRKLLLFYLYSHTLMD